MIDNKNYLIFAFTNIIDNFFAGGSERTLQLGMNFFEAREGQRIRTDKRLETNKHCYFHDYLRAGRNGRPKRKKNEVALTLV